MVGMIDFDLVQTVVVLLGDENKELSDKRRLSTPNR